MRNCKDIFHKHKAFNDMNLDKMEKRYIDPKIKAAFKRKPYEGISEYYERIKKENECI